MNDLHLLIIDTYYHRFLQSFYARNPSIVSKSYFEHKDLIMSQCFGTADYYSSNLKKLGRVFQRSDEAPELVGEIIGIRRSRVRCIQIPCEGSRL